MTGEKANILLVDDRPENLLALEAILEPLGQNLVRAGSGEEALKRLLRDDFALILLDVQMPGLDGFQTAAYIRRRERTRGIPIIFLTAIHKDERHIARGYSEGAVDYLLKPFDPNVLRSKVRVFLELYQKDRALRENEQLFRRAFEDAPVGVALVGVGERAGQVLRVNRALCEITGYTEQALLETTLESMAQVTQAGEADLLPRVLAGEAPSCQVEATLGHAAGEQVPALLGASLVHDAHRHPMYAVIQVLDLTERERAERDLTRAREELARRAARQRQAMEMNDTVVQGLSVAKYAFDEGEVETGRRAVEQTLESAQQIICDLLEGALAELAAGDFRSDTRVTLNGE
jgi:PAS domain S-box-containing protein